MQLRTVRGLELAALTLGAAAWTTFLRAPDGIAVVPEYVAVGNAILLLATAAMVMVVVRRLWLWLLWWSLPLSFLVLSAAILPSLPVADDLAAQLSPAPRQGFTYSAVIGACGTFVTRTVESPVTDQRFYVLEQHCFPDGVEHTDVYVRQGASVLMRRVSSHAGRFRLRGGNQIEASRLAPATNGQPGYL